MTRDECRMPSCSSAPGSQDDREDYRTGRFCSVQHDVLYSKRKQDARNAAMEAGR